MVVSNYTQHELLILKTFLNSYCLGIIKPIKAHHIRYYAKNNKAIDPRPYIHSLPDNIKIKIREVVKNNPFIVDKWITYEYLIKEIEKKRGDLFFELINPKHEVWFRKFLVIIKKSIKTI